MHEALNNNVFFVKEHVGLLKAAHNYDILDPETQQILLECREEPGVLTKILRFTDYKRYTPFNVLLRTPDGRTVLRVQRGITLLRSTVSVFDETDQLAGTFKQKLFTIGGKFEIFDAQGTSVCMLQGKWTSWEFRFMQGDSELAHVTKKWSGVGKELFTTADNYILEIAPTVPASDPVRALILGAVMVIDLVLKE